MEHPKLFPPGDPLVDRVRALCLRYPEAIEVEVWGRPTFRAGKKIFVTLGSSMERPHAIVFKPESEERLAQLEDPMFFVPPYFGAVGWMAIDVDAPDTDWSLIAELIDTSYRQVALKRMLAALDDRDALPLPVR
jgi:hypothetical protein